METLFVFSLRFLLIYLTPLLIIQVTRPATFPCFGVLRNEKHVVLHSVSDIVVEQGKLKIMQNKLVHDDSFKKTVCDLLLNY